MNEQRHNQRTACTVLAVIFLFGLGGGLLLAKFATPFEVAVFSHRGHGAATAARVPATPELALLDYAARILPGGLYMFEGEVRNTADVVAGSPILTVEVRSPNQESFLDSQWIILPDLRPGERMQFTGSLHLGPDVDRVQAVVGAGNYAIGIGERVVLDSKRAM